MHYQYTHESQCGMQCLQPFMILFHQMSICSLNDTQKYSISGIQSLLKPSRQMTVQLGSNPSMSLQLIPVNLHIQYFSCTSTSQVSLEIFTIKSGLLPDLSIKSTPNVVIGICGMSLISYSCFVY